MIINSKQILECIAPDMPPMAVRHASGELAFSADYDRVVDLCLAGNVCGRSKGRSLRYLELIVPLEDICRSERAPRSRGGMVAEDSRTIERDRTIISHDFPVCATFGPKLGAISRLRFDDLAKLPSSEVRLAYAECVGA